EIKPLSYFFIFDIMTKLLYYSKKKHNNRILKHGQYWDTVKLKDGTLIYVVKSRYKSYPNKF
ncbi:unnamed protein product, partial [marine sediment metagenome]